MDHSSFFVLVHFFPKHDIPVVQLSINGTLSKKESFEIGKKRIPLREEGYLIFARGNIVHHLRMMEGDNPKGTKEADVFDLWVKDRIFSQDI